MTLWSYMGHRVLAFFLVFVAITFFLMAGFSPSEKLGQFFIVLGFLTAIASAYFFKTKHV